MASLLSPLFFAGVSAFVLTVKASRVNPPTKIISLAQGVSKAAYLPVGSGQYIKDGKIMDKDNQNTCEIDGWTAKSHEIKETEVFVFKHDELKLIVFGFRGTASKQDWFYNLDTNSVNTRTGESSFDTHRGFRNRYFDIAPWFEQEYHNVPKDYTVVLTGHSLGGAEAIMAATFAAGELKRRPDAVITFGEPLIGKENFKEYYRKVVGCDRTLILTAKFDPVVSLPFGYQHPCDKMEVDSKLPFWSPLKIHSLYGGYDEGIKRDYEKNEIDYGCDKILS